MIENTMVRSADEKNEHARIKEWLNMAENDNNPHVLQREDIEGSIPFRVALLERNASSLERFSDELRLGQTTREQQIIGLKERCDRLDSEVQEARKTQAKFVETIEKRLEGITDKFDGLVGDFNSFKSSNKTMLISILVAVVTSLVLIIGSRWITP